MSWFNWKITKLSELWKKNGKDFDSIEMDITDKEKDSLTCSCPICINLKPASKKPPVGIITSSVSGPRAEDNLTKLTPIELSIIDQSIGNDTVYIITLTIGETCIPLGYEFTLLEAAHNKVKFLERNVFATMSHISLTYADKYVTDYSHDISHIDS